MINTIEKEPFTWIDFEINNFKQFNDLVKDWSIDFHQLDGGLFYSKLRQCILPEILIAQTTFTSHIDQKGKSPDDMWSFVVMSEDSSMYKFNHEETKSNSTMVIYSPGAKINAVSAPGFNVYIFSIEKNYFHKISLSLGFNKIEDKLKQIDRVELNDKQSSTLRNLMKNMLDMASSMDEKSFTIKEKNFFLELLPMQFLKEIYLNVKCAKNKTLKDKHIFYMQVRAYMHTHLHTTMTINDICKKFDISSRTLRNYFQDELNISPKQYLTILRLQKVRDILLSKNNKVLNIEQTARKFGFNHMGQFSGSYKEFFNEIPSETLNKRKNGI